MKKDKLIKFPQALYKNLLVSELIHKNPLWKIDEIYCGSTNSELSSYQDFDEHESNIDSSSCHDEMATFQEDDELNINSEIAALNKAKIDSEKASCPDFAEVDVNVDQLLFETKRLLLNSNLNTNEDDSNSSSSIVDDDSNSN